MDKFSLWETQGKFGKLNQGNQFTVCKNKNSCCKVKVTNIWNIQNISKESNINATYLWHRVLEFTSAFQRIHMIFVIFYSEIGKAK